ncbi:MAG: tRNA threonylcarbamoyladenosine dehydratase [Clostridia bacterium]|nr:tRNA threonylcarbamoyladenosine dehydratase [Clostridia bacterium]
MKEEFEREAMLLGDEAIKKLNNSYVALFGLGGVGSYTAEALARSGVGRILLVDNDKVSKSNINRQLCALQSTVGRYKVDVVAERLLDINPDIIIEKRYDFVLPENIDSFDLRNVDYIVDAIDTVSAKLALAEKAKEFGVPMISSMGTGNKLDPTALTVTDITKTSVCPLARVMRRELKKRGISHLKVVFSTEEPITPSAPVEGKKIPPASIAFVPSVAGLIAASEVVKDIVSK